jgi:hypothetical protein
MKTLASLLFAVAACGGSSGSGPASPAPAPIAAAICEVGGCNGTACAEPGKQMMTTCEYRPEFACYPSATCERQSDARCGWSQSAELVACLANPPPAAGPPDSPTAPASQTPTASTAR